jgi:hypothetical protein
MNPLSMKNMYNIIFNEMKTNNEIIEVCKEKIKYLEEKWKSSNRTDFSIYTHENYLYDMFICWNYFSKFSIGGMLNYFRKNILNYKDLEYFDDYNGTGMTTLPLIKEGLKTYFYNDNSNQSNTFQLLCDKLNFIRSEYDYSAKIYDVYISLEVIEHYKEPFLYLQKIMNKTKKDSYLVYATTFKSEYLGHFDSYIYEGNVIEPKKMNRTINNYLKENFDLLFIGFNGLPKIYRRK